MGRDSNKIIKKIQIMEEERVKTAEKFSQYNYASKAKESSALSSVPRNTDRSSQVIGDRERGWGKKITHNQSLSRGGSIGHYLSALVRKGLVATRKSLLPGLLSQDVPDPFVSAKENTSKQRGHMQNGASSAKVFCFWLSLGHLGARWGKS